MNPKIIIRLGIVCYTTTAEGQFLLLTNKDNSVPNIRVFGGADLDHFLEKMFTKYLGYAFGWLDFCLVSAEKDEDTLFLYYVCLVPPNSKNTNGKWVSYMNVFQNKEGLYNGYEKIIENVHKVTGV